VLAVPGGPVEEGVDRHGVPSVRVALGEPVAPDLVGHVDQADRDAIRQRG
jgi:hypothetical protein